MHVLVKSAVLLHSEHVGQVRVLHHCSIKLSLLLPLVHGLEVFCYTTSQNTVYLYMCRFRTE